MNIPIYNLINQQTYSKLIQMDFNLCSCLVRAFGGDKRASIHERSRVDTQMIELSPRLLDLSPSQ